MTATESRRGTRGGAIAVLGAAVNGAFGFVLTTVILRTFTPAGSGALFSVIGLVTIAGAVCCAGADTALIWALSRRPAASGRLVRVALLPTLALSLAVCLGGVAGAAPIGRALLGGESAAGLIRLAAVGVPVVVVSTVLLAAVRATRPVGTYVAVQFVFVPVARPALMIGAVAAGGGVLLGFAGWLLPLALAAALALALLTRPGFATPPVGPAAGSNTASPIEPGAGSGTAPSRGPGARSGCARGFSMPSEGPGIGINRAWRPLWAFALPRAASVAIDASSMWVGVLLTGALASPAEAGVFAAAGRYALAGLLIMQGLRVAVAPRLSRLLGAGRRAEAARVYRRTTLAIVLLSWPAYLLLAAFAPAFLAVFGAPFGGGATPLAVLALAMLVNVGVGLVQTVLLMSGNSRDHLRATAAGLALNVLVAVLLIPGHGALGAAIAWSLGIVGENVLAAWYARRALGESIFSVTLGRAMAAVVAATGLVTLLGILAAGRELAGLALALGLLLAALLGSLADRRIRAALLQLRRNVLTKEPL